PSRGCKGIGICDKRSESRSRIKLRNTPMWVRDNVGIGLTRTRVRRYIISQASVITIRSGVVHAERRSCLPTCNSGELPTPEQTIPQSRSFEKRQVVYGADLKEVSLVEVRRSPERRRIIRVQDSAITKNAAIGRVVDGMAVGIRHVELQRSETAPQLRLQCVIAGSSAIVQTSDT